MARDTALLSQTEALLETEGHRITSTRRGILKAIAAAEQPLTIEEIGDSVPDIGRATVFRTVKLLTELGVICRVTLENRGIRYVLSTSSHHHHLVCSNCGSVTEFESPQLDQAIHEEAEAAGFTLSSHTVELYGKCGNC
jgi:Fur family transcriptional regulator, ferric uptake regulator